jgi:hypothetical protein
MAAAGSDVLMSTSTVRFQPLDGAGIVELDPDFNHARVCPRRRVDVEDVVLENQVADPHDLAANRLGKRPAAHGRRLTQAHVPDVGLVDLGNRAHMGGIAQGQDRAGANLFARLDAYVEDAAVIGSEQGQAPGALLGQRDLAL